MPTPNQMPQQCGAALPEHRLSMRLTHKRKFYAVCACGWVGCAANTEAKAFDKAWDDHVAAVTKVTSCPTPDKKRYHTQATAEAAVALFWRTSAKRRNWGKKIPTRAYECVCGRWHLTALPRRESNQ